MDDVHFGSTASADAVNAPTRDRTNNPTVKDTLESILIAFILAFIFRAFIVEAFVIPTGSMGPTLLGAHMRFRCPDCGYAFDVNYSSLHDTGDDLNIPSVAGPITIVQEQRNASGQKVRVATVRDQSYNAFCPNCGYKIDQSNPTDPEDAATNPPVYYGDRILVLKYLYLFEHPHRFDVVVFKNPNDETRQYQTNYIKRLIGNPGESVLLLDGDIYIAKSAGTNLSDFTVQAKPRYAQEALWRIVYDNDFYPMGRERPDSEKWSQPWQPTGGSGWDQGSAQSAQRIFKFDNAGGAGSLSFNPHANPNSQPLTDWLGYDSDYMSHYRPLSVNVSDLKLSFFYQRRSGDGPLRLQLSKRGDLFTAEIYSDHVTLIRTHAGGGNETIGEADIKPTSRAMHVEFANVDYQVSVRIDDRDLIKTTPQQYHPDLEKLLADFENDNRPPAATVGLTGERQSSILSHISLWRDVYYTNSENNIYSASPRNFPAQVAHLASDQYFVLGDNSVMSLDARYWTKDVNLPEENLQCPAGRVPQRFMLGKAFFVYWPAGFRPVSNAPSLIPDFGDMRFIH